jgi:secondary thiamine-phosphate synthase enzyme
MSLKVQTESVAVETKGFADIIDITQPIVDTTSESGLKDGTITVFIPGSTAGITTIEYESGAVEDLKKAIDRLAPINLHYAHDARWGDGNGFSHVRAALMGASITIPFNNKNLLLGTWQQIVLCDFDNRPRSRNVLIQLMGV